jgi:hypothetical protein
MIRTNTAPVTLIALAAGMVFATLAACVTTPTDSWRHDKAPQGAALALLLGGAILPSACLGAAAQR